ncbi:nuclease-related domain-containing protein [Lysinibacillus sp. 54212]|uniref:nuclease-related domain-containing protein n=1 Tax=Lysinibacillus sp. 54212 TaxID=3119829 RepID=UPI002FCA7B4C
MIVLERAAPRKLVQLHALLRRLDSSDPDFAYYKDLSTRLKVGLAGEQRVDREWIEMPSREKHCLFLNYEFLNDFGIPHQIDTLLLTSHFLLIIEIKNISGRLDFEDDKHQLIRSRQDGSVEGFTNPIDQVLRHVHYIKKLLDLWKVSLPVQYAIVISNPSTIIGRIPSGIPIFHASGLRSYLGRLFAKHSTAVLSHEKVDQLAEVFLARLERIPPSPTTVSKERLRKGVLCEVCHYQETMLYKYGTWCCPSCGVRNKKAVLQALDDYRLLIGERITNQEFRAFFGIESMAIASKLLARLPLKSGGEKRGRYYIIPEDINQ